MKISQIALFIFILTLFGQFPVLAQKTDNFELLEMDIATLQGYYKTGKYTIKQVTNLYLARIKELDKNGPTLNSIIIINPDALNIAEKLDKAYKKSKNKGLLYGIPIILKDNIDTHDNMPTTAGSRALANSYPLQDSYIAKKLKAAGAIIIAKANLSEWANFRGQKSISGWSGLLGQTKNPYVLDCNPCGSSAGSGVAVSANLAMAAIGTETNGSIVCPANANGIVGIKPTVGLLSRSGIIPISFTQDTPGPMARTVADAATMLGIMVGVDITDSKTLASQGKYRQDYTQYLDKNGLKGKRIGLYRSPMGKLPRVDSLMFIAINYLKSKGAEIIEIDEIGRSTAASASFDIMIYELKDGLNTYFKSLGPNAPIKTIEDLIEFNKKDSVELKLFNQRYLELAQKKGDLLSKEYLESLRINLEGSQKYGIDSVMNLHSLDAIIAPTGGPAWKTKASGDTFRIGSSSPAARAGYPNISVPLGFVDELPVGISFFGRAWSEPTLIKMAYAYEQGSKQRNPPRFIKSQ